MFQYILPLKFQIQLLILEPKVNSPPVIESEPCFSAWLVYASSPVPSLFPFHKPSSQCLHCNSSANPCLSSSIHAATHFILFQNQCPLKYIIALFIILTLEYICYYKNQYLQTSHLQHISKCSSTVIILSQVRQDFKLSLYPQICMCSCHPLIKEASSRNRYCYRNLKLVNKQRLHDCAVPHINRDIYNTIPASKVQKNIRKKRLGDCKNPRIKILQ